MADDNVLFPAIHSHGGVRFSQSQRDSEIFAKGIRIQLDFWLGNRNNTIGYRPEISDLNHFKGFSVNWGQEGVIFRGSVESRARRG